MGNSATRSRKRNIPVVQTKTKSISDIETARTGTQDFSTTHTLTGDIPSVEDISEAPGPVEEIIIKCSLEEMTKSFFQDYAIVWHDPNVNSQENQQYITQLKKFCDVLTFTEWQKAKDYIQSSPTACHVVTSGTNGELLVKEISSSLNVANIYIFCGNRDYHSAWAKNYSQVSCVETDIKSVLSQIHSNLLAWYKQASSLKLNLPAFAPIFNDTDKSQMNNLHRFLKIIPNFQSRLQAKTDFLNLSEAIYSSDPHNTQFLTDFEQNYNEYDKEQTLRWYSQESFLYKVTNNCLRIATSDSIQYCRLLLQDIEHAIKEQYHTKSKNFNGLLYRGAYLSQKEWSSLKANLGQEIEMHGFLSVSKKKNIGLNFMKVDPTKKVFITIIVPKGPNEEDQGFAEIHEFSEYPQEKEILFNVRSRFTILETEDDGPYRHLVLLYGAQGFRKYMNDQNPILEISIPKTEKILCNHCKVLRTDQIFFVSLIDPQTQIYYCQNCLNFIFAPFLCLPPDINPQTIKIPGFLLKNSCSPELPFYGYKCEGCQTKKQKQNFFFTCVDCHQQYCQNCFFESHCTQAKHKMILESPPFTFWSQKMSHSEFTHIKFQSDLTCNLLASDNLTLQQAQMYFECQLYEKAIEIYSLYIQQNEATCTDSNIAICYHSLGVISQKRGNSPKALEYCFESLKIFTSIPHNSEIANIYSDIGSIYNSQAEYTKALEFYLKSLEKSKSQTEIFTCYNNIGLVSHYKGEYKKAFEYYFKSLDLAKSAYGDTHPKVAVSLYNIGSAYDEQGEYPKALEYYEKSLDIIKSLYGDHHPDISVVWIKIGQVYSRQAQYKKALEFAEKSLENIKSFYGDNHPEVAVSLHNIGSAYEDQGEYKKALEYYEKSLDILKLVYGNHHPDIAKAWSKIGHVYFRQAQFKKALEYYFRSLNINKAVYGEIHSEIATSYQNIGLVYDTQGEYAKTLKYYFKSLGIFKLACGPNHPTTAKAFNNIGMAFFHQAEFQKALEYYFKSIDIFKLVFGDSHPEIALSLNNIGMVYCQQGEYQKALEYLILSLNIKKSVYQENHPGIATSCNNIGAAFFRLGECEKALEYYLKSLDILKLAYGENHPLVAASYNNVGLVLLHQGEYTKTLEYYFKSIDILKLVYGNSHPDLATSYQNVGQLYGQQGEYKKSLEYYLKSLNIAKSIYGENHPTTGTLYNSIALASHKQGEFQKALEYFFKALDSYRAFYGDGHPDVANSYLNIGLMYSQQGEHMKAIEYFLPCLKIQKSLYGDNHPNTIFTQQKILQEKDLLFT